jgi:membrane-bound serine protease (ClpP class)
MSSLTHLSPDAALFLLTFGLLLIFLELNRPGWIIPGGFGLLVSLLSIDSLRLLHHRPTAKQLIVTATGVLLVNLLRPTHIPAAVAATLALVLGFQYLVRGPATFQVHALTAATCGILLGVASFLLTSIARRARTNKRVRLT